MAIDYTSDSITSSQAGPQVPRRQLFCDEVGRREFVCGGGASVLSVILATLLAGSKPVSLRPSTHLCSATGTRTTLAVSSVSCRRTVAS